MIRQVPPQGGESQPPTLKQEAEFQIHQLKAAGKTRSTKELEKQIDLAKAINDRVLKEIPNSNEQTELRAVAKELISEIKAFDHYRLELEPRKSEIWVGKILTRLLFVAAKALSPSKTQKALAHAVEAAENALSNDPNNTEKLKTHLETINALREKANSPGVIFDLSTLCQSRLIFHISYASGENPYLKLEKLELSEILLRDEKLPIEEYRKLQALDLADFRAAIKENLKPQRINFSRAVTKEMAEQLSIALVKNDTDYLEDLIKQLTSYPHDLDSVSSKLEQYPNIKESLEKLPIWKEAQEYRAIFKAGLKGEQIAEYHKLMQVNAPLDFQFWEKLGQLPIEQREAVLDLFPQKKDKIIKEAERLAELPPGDTKLLAYALPVVEKIFYMAEGSRTGPFVTKFSDDLAAVWRKERPTDWITDPGSHHPLEQQIHSKALERWSQHIVDDFTKELTAVRKQTPSKDWYKKALEMGEKDLPLLEKMEKTGQLKGVGPLIKRYKTELENQKIYSSLSEESIQSEVKGFNDRFERVTTYEELMQLEKEINSYNSRQLDDEIRRLEASDPEIAQRIKREQSRASVSREKGLKELQEKINRQKEVIGFIGMLSKKPVTKISLNEIIKGYQSLIGQTDPKIILEKGIQLERQAAAYKNDPPLQKLRQEASQKIFSAANVLKRMAKIKASGDQLDNLFKDVSGNSFR